MIKGTVLTAAITVQNNLSSRLFNIKCRLYRLTNQIVILPFRELAGNDEIVEKALVFCLLFTYPNVPDIFSIFAAGTQNDTAQADGAG